MVGHANASAFRLSGVAMAALALAAAAPADAAASIYHLSDMPFGTIGNLVADSMQAESVCVATGVAGATGGNYSVTGSGPTGAFALTGPGSATLPYEVQWSASSGQTSGQRLTAGTPLNGQNGTLLDCTLGLVNNASLIVVFRAAALGAATAGSYSGTLTILVAPN